MVRRGQLGRMHEVSMDGTHWVRAATYSELFASAPVKLVARDMPVGSPPPAARPAVSPGSGIYLSEEAPVEPATPPQSAAPLPTGQQWYYDHAGTQNGPVEESTLRQLLAIGEIAPNALVWSDGMKQWMAATAIPGLVPVTQPIASGFATDEDRGTSGSLPSSLCKAAISSRPWAIFLAVTAFVYAGLWVVLGFLMLASGAEKNVPTVVAMGLFWIINGFVVAVGGVLLANYASRLGSLTYGKAPILLENALERLRAFWMYVSIVLIVALAFILFFVIWIMAIATSTPNWF
ncbi:MAG: DUF4339 domain-containing protein [Thermoguttaceae bacterium]